jgi:hypothetical protein
VAATDDKTARDRVARTAKTARGQRRSWWGRLRRLLRYRLVVPIKRSQHPPEYTARGVAVGVAWALTPTVGIQMPLCLATWAVARRLAGWDFNVIIAMAWTWITNVVTLLPTYYIFYVTGQLILGHFDDLSGYDEFVGLWHRNVGEEGPGGGAEGFWIGFWTYTVTLFKGWGVPLMVGSLPWAAAGTWLSYRWSLRFVRSHREHRHQRLLARLRGEHPEGFIAEFIHEHDPFHRHDGDGKDGGKDDGGPPAKSG